MSSTWIMQTILVAYIFIFAQLLMGWSFNSRELILVSEEEGDWFLSRIVMAKYCQVQIWSRGLVLAILLIGSGACGARDQTRVSACKAYALILLLSLVLDGWVIPEQMTLVPKQHFYDLASESHKYLYISTGHTVQPLYLEGNFVSEFKCKNMWGHLGNWVPQMCDRAV